MMSGFLDSAANAGGRQVSVAYIAIQFHNCGVIYGMQADKGPNVAIIDTIACVRATI